MRTDLDGAVTDIGNFQFNGCAAGIRKIIGSAAKKYSPGNHLLLLVAGGVLLAN